jgi:hypothetical protein
MHVSIETFSGKTELLDIAIGPDGVAVSGSAPGLTFFVLDSLAQGVDNPPPTGTRRASGIRRGGGGFWGGDPTDTRSIWVFSDACLCRRAPGAPRSTRVDALRPARGDSPSRASRASRLRPSDGGLFVAPGPPEVDVSIPPDGTPVGPACMTCATRHCHLPQVGSITARGLITHAPPGVPGSISRIVHTFLPVIGFRRHRLNGTISVTTGAIHRPR